MSRPQSNQKFQDWFTQQWIIWWGRKIIPSDVPWLIGPFGQMNGIGEDFINQLVEKEGLDVVRNVTSCGLIESMSALNLSAEEMGRLSTSICHFYEYTAHYDLKLKVKWNPLFRFFGYVVRVLFSRRINQLNIPTSNHEEHSDLSSELIELVDFYSREVKYVIWLRKFKTSGKVIYSGIYGLCTLPSGQVCVRAVFPLPNGNATVIMSPHVDSIGNFILDSSGKKFGDAGFYFLMRDIQGEIWSQYLVSFRDQLIVENREEGLKARQKLTLWHMRVVRFWYDIERK